MKQVVLIAALLAATAAPALSSAQNVNQERREYQDAKGDLRQDQRAARRDGVVTPTEQHKLANDRSDVRQQGRDVNQAQRWNRANRNWMQQRGEFRAYNGRRAGFWFAPGFGYVRIDPRFNSYGWRAGVIVPWQLRNYAVADPWFYGVQPAPPGYRWVWLDNNIALINLRSGAIVRVVTGIY